jgi:hypothetical protein
MDNYYSYIIYYIIILLYSNERENLKANEMETEEKKSFFASMIFFK